MLHPLCLQHKYRWFQKLLIRPQILQALDMHLVPLLAFFQIFGLFPDFVDHLISERGFFDCCWLCQIVAASIYADYRVMICFIDKHAEIKEAAVT